MPRTAEATTIEVIRLPYVTQRVRVGTHGQRTYDPTQLLHPDVFVRTRNARDLRKGRVSMLSGVLESRNNFSGVWKVNHRGNKLRMIDCNHRFAGMEKFFATNPDVEIEVELHVYENLNEEQERTEYNHAANNAAQSTSDFLQQYKETINIWHEMDKGYAEGTFPVRVSHKTVGTTLGLHNLLYPYLTKDAVPYSGGYDGAPKDFVPKLQEWNGSGKTLNTEGYIAYNTMKAFLYDYIDCFGDIAPNNRFWKAPIFYVLFRLWYDNKTTLTMEQLKRELKKLGRGVAFEKVKAWSKLGAARNNVRQAILEYVELINNGRTRNRVFFRDWHDDLGVEVRRYKWDAFEPITPA